MATRPAASRGGLTGAHYGMISFAIVAVAALGLFIFTLTRVSGAEDAADRARKQLAQYGNPPSYYADEASARKSNVFGVMANDLREVAKLVTGSPEDVGPTILAKSDQVLAELAQGKPQGSIEPGQTLLTALTQMNRLYTEARSAADGLAVVVADLQTENGNLIQQLAAKEDAFAAQVESLNGQLQQARDDMFSGLKDKDTQLQDTQGVLDASEQAVQQLRRDAIELARNKDVDILRLQSQVERLQREMQAFKLSLDPTAILTKADGKVLRAVPGSDIVYVNLGAADKIRIGMPFEVFSQTGELPDGLSGKSSLEVVNVMEDTAECRVTRRTAGQPIVEGDTVVNIAYERGRKPKFVIRGEFDLNYDGTPDWNGLEQITGIIRQWGGQVVDELDESVDFVVIGLPPTIPALARGQQVSAVIQAQAVQKQLELSEFRALVDRAQKMYIPVITQNPFLFLTGYAGQGDLAAR